MKPQYPLVFSSLFIRLGIGVMVTQISVSFVATSYIPDWAIAVFAIGSVVMGTLISMVHLGKPNRFFHAFYNISSPLTWEAILTPLLLGSMSIVAVASYFGMADIFLLIGKIGSMICGVALIYTMGKVYHLKARPSWSSSMVVYEFFLSAACMGVLGLAGILSFQGGGAESVVKTLAGWAFVLLVLEAAITLGYRRFVSAVSLTAAAVLEENASKGQYYAWLGLGLLIPLTVSAIILVTGQGPPVLVCLAFVSFFLGALFWRILFFKCATPMKITPDIDLEKTGSSEEHIRYQRP